MAAATPPHWDLRYIDENLQQEPPPVDPLPEVVGITVHLTFAKRAYELARWYRAHGSKVVMGGPHVQSCPFEVSRHADAIAVGEGVHTWPRILQDVERGRLRPVYPGSCKSRFGSRKGYVRRLCHAARPLETTWSAAVTADVADDPSLVREMALAGCTNVSIRLSTRAPAECVRIFHDHGIRVNGRFVLGFDEDGPDIFARTIAWIEEQRLERASFCILTPYPATPLFRRMEAAGRLLHRDWEKYDTAHVVFRPQCMTPARLMAGYLWCRERSGRRSVALQRGERLDESCAQLAGARRIRQVDGARGLQQ